MDLVHGARRVLVMSEHRTRFGEPKLVERCAFPLTGRGVVHRVLTDLGVLDVDRDRGFVLRELAPRTEVEEVLRATAAPVVVELEKVGEAPTQTGGGAA